jgi:hypothetical protein
VYALMTQVYDDDSDGRTVYVARRLDSAPAACSGENCFGNCSGRPCPPV